MSRFDLHNKDHSADLNKDKVREEQNQQKKRQEERNGWMHE
jgi:hypothetical protein